MRSIGRPLPVRFAAAALLAGGLLQSLQLQLGGSLLQLDGRGGHTASFERKNMFYEASGVRDGEPDARHLIDEHATAFQVVGDQALVYYDPLNDGCPT